MNLAWVKARRTVKVRWGNGNFLAESLLSQMFYLIHFELIIFESIVPKLGSATDNTGTIQKSMT